MVQLPFNVPKKGARANTEQVWLGPVVAQLFLHQRQPHTRVLCLLDACWRGKAVGVSRYLEREREREQVFTLRALISRPRGVLPYIFRPDFYNGHESVYPS